MGLHLPQKPSSRLRLRLGVGRRWHAPQHFSNHRITFWEQEATRNKCIATSNKCLTSSNKKLVVKEARQTFCRNPRPTRWCSTRFLINHKTTNKRLGSIKVCKQHAMRCLAARTCVANHVHAMQISSFPQEFENDLDCLVVSGPLPKMVNLCSAHFSTSELAYFEEVQSTACCSCG